MSDEVSKEEFRRRWRDHVDDLERLSQFLEGTDGDRLGLTLLDLRELVDQAAENRERYRDELVVAGGSSDDDVREAVESKVDESTD